MPKTKHSPSLATLILGGIVIVLITMIATYVFINRNQNLKREALRNEIKANLPQRPVRGNGVVVKQPVVAPATIAPARPVVPRTGGTIRRVNRRNHYYDQAE